MSALEQPNGFLYITHSYSNHTTYSCVDGTDITAGHAVEGLPSPVLGGELWSDIYI